MDSAGVGTEINCPSCSEPITIPEPNLTGAPRDGQPAGPGGASPRLEGQRVSAMSSSAAAKVEMHLKVPTHTHTESLIQKANVPLEVAAKTADKKMRVKTIRHTDCIEVGHDKFDEVVTNFLNKVGESNVVSVTPLTYTHVDIGSQKLLTDFAVMIIYRG